LNVCGKKGRVIALIMALCWIPSASSDAFKTNFHCTIENHSAQNHSAITTKERYEREVFAEFAAAAVAGRENQGPAATEAGRGVEEQLPGVL